MTALRFFVLLLTIFGVESPPMLISDETVECVEESGKRGFKDPKTNIDHLCFTTDDQNSCNITFAFEEEKMKFCRDVCCRDDQSHTLPTPSGTKVKPRTNLSTTPEFPEKGKGKGKESNGNEYDSKGWRISTYVLLVLLGLAIAAILFLIMPCCRKKTRLNNQPNNQSNDIENGNHVEQQPLQERETWGS